MTRAVALMLTEHLARVDRARAQVQRNGATIGARLLARHETRHVIVTAREYAAFHLLDRYAWKGPDYGPQPGAQALTDAPEFAHTICPVTLAMFGLGPGLD